jgi:phage shock protein E
MIKRFYQKLRSLVPSVSSGTPSQAETQVENGAYKQLGGKYLIDVRTKVEWKAGHIEGAILIPHYKIKSRIGAVTQDKSAHIAVYCRSGHRAGIALKALKELGYMNVENLGSLQDARKKLGITP